MPITSLNGGHDRAAQSLTAVPVVYLFDAPGLAGEHIRRASTLDDGADHGVSIDLARNSGAEKVRARCRWRLSLEEFAQHYGKLTVAQTAQMIDRCMGAVEEGALLAERFCKEISGFAELGTRLAALWRERGRAFAA